MKRTRSQANHDRWLVSYADFVTLLFAFFVVLYATAEVNRHRMNQLAVAIQAGFQQMGMFSNAPAQSFPAGHPLREVSTSVQDNFALINVRRHKAENRVPEPSETVRLTLESELHERNIPPEYVSVREGADGVVISLREIGFFDSGSAHIRPQAAPVFAKVATMMAEQHSQFRIEGHTDNVPIHNANFNSNWELSTARATEVIRLLVTQYGFNPQILSAAGYAEFHPIATNDTEEGRSANRRVDIVVLMRAPQSALVPSY